MLEKIGFGVVAKYNPEEGYGFMRPIESPVGSRGTVFFHINNGRYPRIIPTFWLATVSGPLEKRGARLAIPKEGDELVYRSALSDRGPRAEHWTTRSLWNELHKQLIEWRYITRLGNGSVHTHDQGEATLETLQSWRSTAPNQDQVEVSSLYQLRPQGSDKWWFGWLAKEIAA